MDINIFIVLLIYLFLFNENKIIKRLLLIYLIIYILSNLYKCFFKKIIEGADTIGEPIDYNKNIYNILNENILLLQDVNSLKQYEKKLKEDIINVQKKFKEEITTIQNKIKNNPTDSYDLTNKLYVDNKSIKFSGTVISSLSGQISAGSSSEVEYCRFNVPASGKYLVTINTHGFVRHNIYSRLCNSSGSTYNTTSTMLASGEGITGYIGFSFSKSYILDLVIGNTVRWLIYASVSNAYNQISYHNGDGTFITYIQL